MDWAKLKEGLKSLITDDMSTEDVSKVTSIVKDLEVAESESNDLLQKHEDLRKKYIEAIKETTFKEKPKEDNPQPKTLEECIQEVVDKRKD